MDKYSVLKQYFGHSEFRRGQERLIDGILEGRDVLGIMPTGGGKSLCYQVPALLLPGVTLVISPLISLMKDQVTALLEAGVDAAFLNSSLNTEQLRNTYGHVRKGAYKLIYIAPERLSGEGFSELMREQDISLVAVDEAHCISQWGQDFRPSYLKIAEFVEKLPRRPILAAFTATATAEVRRDIVRLLHLQNFIDVITGFDRPNLFFDVQHPRNKMAVLSSLIEQRRNKSGIVYCATRAAVERVCDALNAYGILATRYHAGLSDDERQQNQDDFQFDRKTVMVATNAFGMGIDKSNVGFVIHYNMPKSLEAYYQEAGRAGRDGEGADCILLYSSGDITTAKFLIENSGENEELTSEEQSLVRQRDYQRLGAMVGYCKTTSCLRGYILDYFGQTHLDNCNNCSNCRSEYVLMDITIQAQMILSCIKRVKDHLGYYVGATLIASTLRGTSDQRVLKLGLDKLSTYGLLRTVTRQALQAYIDYLETSGYVAINPLHATLEPTERAGNVLFRGEKVTMPVKAENVSEPSTKKGKQKAATPDEDRLLATLKATRTSLAQEEGVPAYIIFSNASLADMATKVPHTMAEFLEVSGVGEVKASRYGEAFLNAISEFEREE